MFKKFIKRKSTTTIRPAKRPKVSARARVTVDHARIFQRGKLGIVAGLRWVPLNKGEKGKLFNEARAEGEHSYCITADGTQIGFFSSNPGGHGKGRGALVSLALLLSSNYSHGGEEVFAFHIDAERSCFVALRDGRPVPGFDVIGSVELVSERLNAYLQLADVASVRRVGAVDLLGNVEEIDWDLLLDEVGSKLRLKKIPDIKKILAMLVVAAVVFVAGFGAVSYKLARDKKLAEEQARIANDPNIVYESKIDDTLAGVSGTGQISLRRMIGGLKKIPLQVRGWRLNKVECKPDFCSANWVRLYGNFADFEQALPASAMGQPDYDVFKPDDLASARLVTRHRLDDGAGGDASTPAPAAPKLIRNALPLRSAVSSKFFSTLQDLSMLEIKVKVEPAKLFGGQGEVENLLRPVVSAAWSIEGPLWTLDDIVLDNYVAVDALTVELATDKDSAAVEKTSYKLSGKYYAKGKDF